MRAVRFAKCISHLPTSEFVMPQTKRRFQVGLSFPGEYRRFVRKVASHLEKKLQQKNVFFDENYEAELARPDLDLYLQRIYLEETDLVAVFLCEAYDKKDWCQLEWRAIRNIIKRKNAHQIMPIRLDDGDVSGIYEIDGYVSVRDREPSEIADLIIERLRLNEGFIAQHSSVSSK